MLFYLLGCFSFENQFSLDDDGDGFTEYDGDCDDSDFNIGPEECQDNDGDTFSEYEGDCDDTDPKVYYNNLEKEEPGCYIDNDGDGVLNQEDLCPNDAGLAGEKTWARSTRLNR